MLQSLFRTQPRQRSLTEVKQIGAEELNERLNDGEPLVLVDVRTPPEYEFDGHIAGARLLPLSTLSRRSHELPQDSTIVCVCRSGARSQTACEGLAAQGFTDVVNLRGGMIDWKRVGLPVQ